MEWLLGIAAILIGFGALGDYHRSKYGTPKAPEKEEEDDDIWDDIFFNPFFDDCDLNIWHRD